MRRIEIRHIHLVCKARHEQAASLGAEILQWLHERGLTARLVDAGAYAAETGAEIPADTPDLAVVLGGDGTMLGAARRLAGKNVPILGINFGRVGFLADAQPEQWREHLAACIDGTAPVRACTTLRWRLLRGGETIDMGAAVNDVVLSRGALSRLINLDLAVDGHEVSSLRGDGVIVSSPVGSSGYSVSAGGPLLFPGLDVLAVTAVCPFLTPVPPMVFSGSSIIDLHIRSGSTECYLTVDGQEGQLLHVDDRVEISGEPGGVVFAGNATSFFERLRTRGFMGQ